MKSTHNTDLLPIGQAAQRLGLNASALRYYDARGLVAPRARPGGRRMYGPDELRRLAFLKIAGRIGLPLDTAAAILDNPAPHWRQNVRDQVEELDQLIERARGAQVLLANLLDCPSEHPANECSAMIDALDRISGGSPVDDLATEFA